MPLITIRTNAHPDESTSTTLLQACSSQIADLLGKPEQYVMTLLETVPAMTMSGSPAAACLLEVRSVGTITPDQARAMSQALCALTKEHLGVPSSRVYINFEGFSGSMWGYDGRTFG